MSLHLETFRVGPMDNNIYLLWDEATAEMVVIDPSIDPGGLALGRARELAAQGFSLKAIWNTHGHFDHVYDNARWKREFDVPLLMHPADEVYIDRLREQALWFGMPVPEAVRPTGPLAEGQTLQVGDHVATLLELPGHSPGSIAFYFAPQGWLIGGDVLFRGSVGRTDLPGGDTQVLTKSLQRLMQLPPATRVLPGHGNETTLERERATNPYCRFEAAVPEAPR